jgi:hypothetical protein
MSINIQHYDSVSEMVNAFKLKYNTSINYAGINSSDEEVSNDLMPEASGSEQGRSGISDRHEKRQQDIIVLPGENGPVRKV